MTDSVLHERKRLAECIQVGEHLARTLATAGGVLEVLLNGTGQAGYVNRNNPDAPSAAEQAGFSWADALERTARRLLELHRIGDGPAPADYARGCLRFAEALRVAAAGQWPTNLDAITAELWRAIDEGERDARLTAKGALRAHAFDAADLRAIGPVGERLAARIEHETRHALAELRRLSDPEPLSAVVKSL